MADFVNGPFGIDHPLVTVRDLDAAAAKLEALGFVVTPRGRHPWGTHNRLALFPGGLLELITIGDQAAVERGDVDRGLFGRLVRDFMARAEGVGMLALHSTDLDVDTAAAEARGIEIAGVIDFRRPVRLPDGSDDVAVVRLAMLTDPVRPQLSFFLCQQMKRALVEVPAWRDHANTARRLFGITYLDDESGSAVRRAEAIWGPCWAPQCWASAGGTVEVVTPSSFQARFPGLELSPAMLARRPAPIAVSVLVEDLSAAADFVRRAAPEARFSEEHIQIPASYLADTIIEFVAG